MTCWWAIFSFYWKWVFIYFDFFSPPLMPPRSSLSPYQSNFILFPPPPTKKPKPKQKIAKQKALKKQNSESVLCGHLFWTCVGLSWTVIDVEFHKDYGSFSFKPNTFSVVSSSYRSWLFPFLPDSVPLFLCCYLLILFSSFCLPLTSHTDSSAFAPQMLGFLLSLKNKGWGLDKWPRS